MPITSLPTPKSGQPITAAFFDGILSRLMSRIVGGKNITVRTIGGGKITIDCTAPYVRGGGKGGGKVSEYSGEDRAALLSAIEAAKTEGIDVEGAFGRTTGAVKRAYRYMGEVLICYTHLESS